MMSKISDIIAKLAAPVAEKHGCELWDVEYIKEAGAWFLRVYIDRVDGVSIDLCEAVSHDLDPILDEHDDLIPGSYTFEVSSAGAERQLRRQSDFDRFVGHLVEVKLYKSKDGQKVYLGVLRNRDAGGAVEIDVSGQTICFAENEVASVRLRIGKVPETG
ncbi:MAG: ribosome maturation factor RimP [Oscillospiraceae bacterium]|nr:ribosome maturation factor RimP [Oscillospiraceae bacterium]